ncbi:MAG: hypothetical protein ACR650_11275 [Methylocystis sp.]
MNRNDLQQALDAVLLAQPGLTRGGFKTSESDGLDERHRIPLDEFERAFRWVLAGTPGALIKMGSYAAKHIAESWAGGYVSNGAMIAAALAWGLMVSRIAGSPNASIYFGQRQKKKETKGGFRHFVQQSHAHETPYGDFIRDARDDRQLPDDFGSKDDLAWYLCSRRATQDCLRLVPTIFRRYRAFRSKQKSESVGA